MKTPNKFLSILLVFCIIIPVCCINTAYGETSPQEGIIWDFNSESAVAEANAAVGSATCGSITADKDFVNSYDVSATFTTNSTRRMLVKLPNNTIQLKDADGKYVYNYLHVLIGNPQSKAVTFGCGIVTTSENAQVTLPANSWTVASFYIEDLFLAGNSNYKRDGKSYADSVQGVAFQMSDQAGGNNTTNAGIKYNLDKIWVTSNPLDKFELDSISPMDGYNEMSPVDAELRFAFKRNLKQSSEFVLDDAFISSDGEPIDAKVKPAGNILYVRPTDILKINTAYSLDFGDMILKDCYGTLYSKNLTCSFSTSKSSVLSGNLKACDASGNEIYCLSDGGTITLSTNAFNVSSDAAEALIAAVWIDNETCNSHLEYTSSCELSANMTEAVSLQELKLDVLPNSTLYAFVVNNTSDFSALMPSYIKLTDSIKTSGTVYLNSAKSTGSVITLNEPDLSVDTLVISGKISSNSPSLIVVGIRDSVSGELMFYMPVESAQDGSFAAQYQFSNAQSGKYEVFATACGNSNAVKREIVYLGDATKEEIRKSFDSDAHEEITPESAFELIKKYRDGMGIPSDYSEALLKHIASVLFEQKPYLEYPEIVDTMNNAVSALNDLNDASWSSYNKVFKDYAIILNDDSSLEKYNKYDDKGKAEIHKLAAEKSPFSDFAKFRKALCDAEKIYATKLEEVKTQSVSKPSSRPSSGSSGGFSGGSVSISASTSQGTNIKDETTAPVADTASGNAEFSDVSSDHWSYKALNELTKRNIISGYADGTFGGDKNVTRAEFVKILTGVFGFAEGTEVKFSDVASDAWYLKFLNRASSVGIVTGNSGKFMPDDVISRQDAVLMIYRSLIYKNCKPDGNKEFTDSISVSDYALEAVGSMGAAGLVSGYGDGSFAPKSNVSRYEAVQMLYNALRYISGGADL